METKQDKIKILLIDDDEMMRIYFRDIFWIHGRSDTYEVIITSTLSEAEKFIKEKETRPDIIFLDVMMPVKGEDNSTDEQINRSLSFVEKVKKDNKSSSIKVIIYSGQKEKSIEVAFRDLGVDGYLIKGELMPKEIIAFTDKIHESDN